MKPRMRVLREFWSLAAVSALCLVAVVGQQQHQEQQEQQQQQHHQQQQQLHQQQRQPHHREARRVSHDNSSRVRDSSESAAAPSIKSAPDKAGGGHLKFEFQRYDGWYNNLANSDWGTPNSRLRRKVAPAYADGVYQMNDDGRPSARQLSQRMMRGEDGLASSRNLTTVFAFFGQVISSEILMASESGCPIEMHRIPIEKCDPMYDSGCKGGRAMPFYRAAYDSSTGQSPNLPREQLNKVTSWIDGSFIYSNSETWLNTMRSFDGRGTLKMVAKPGSTSPSSSTSSSTSSSSTSSSTTTTSSPNIINDHEARQRLGDAHLHEAVGALMASMGTGSGQSVASDATMEQLVEMGVPMSLFGYPVRNKLRAPLINQMPAHHLQMKTAERMFLLGDPRTNQNPVLLTFGILFYRWHNVLAERIHAQHPDWSDEEIFQRARRLVIASLQNIILYEYLPTLLDTPSPYASDSGVTLTLAGGGAEHASLVSSAATGATTGAGNSTASALTTTSNTQNKQQQLTDSQYEHLDLVRPYSGYKPDLHPGISHVFQSAAFRFGHTMIPPGLYLRDDKCRFLKTHSGFKGVRLCSTWWNAEEVVSKVGVEHLIMGAASQIAEREDYVLCNDVRDKLFGPLDFSRRDLAALNIMRGRDNGLADYNTVRQAFKLPKIKQWRDINPKLFERQPELFDELARLYKFKLDNIDLYIGGMLESDLERGRPGPLFRRIIKEQFERLRDADRFWFENLESGIFSEHEIEEIKQIRLYDIIVNSTLIPDDAIQRNVFQFVHDQDPCPQPGQLSSGDMQPCYIVRGHSYFKGNELTYFLVCCMLVLVPLICALAAHLIINWQDKKRRQHKARQEYERNIATSRKQQAAAAAAEADDEGSSSPASSVASSRRSDGTSGGGGANEPEAAKKCEKIYAKEWLHSNLKRKIKVKLGPAPDATIYVLDRMGQVQRQLNLSSSGPSVVVELSVDSHQLATGSATSGRHQVASSPPYPLQASAGSTISLISTGNNGKMSLASSSSSLAPGNNQHHLLSVAHLDEPVDHKPMILIRVARQHDLVLQFASVQSRRKFVFKLQTYLTSINRSLCLYRVQLDQMLVNAETKERRQQRLEQFFREAYSLTFHSAASGGATVDHQPTAIASGDNHSNQAKISPDIGLVMRTSLTRLEFADALGMRPESLFVKQMFNCIDKDGNGQISFQEFLDLVVKFSRGKPDDKLRIVFDMCDHSQRGVIEKQDLVRMLSSLVDIAKTKYLGEHELEQAIEEMFKSVGLDDKPLLNYDDFKLIVSSSSQQQQYHATTNDNQQQQQHNKNIEQHFLPIGLDMKGAKRNFFVDSTTPHHASEDPYLSGTNNNATNKMVTTSQQDNNNSSSLSYSSGTTGQGHRGQLLIGAKSLIRQLGDRWKAMAAELEEHRQDIVYILMFFVIVLVLFFERFINYSYLSEHMDLRHVMGVGIAITRGSAASLSFCYAMLLLTMCRNLMTWIRTMGVREYIPLDSHIKFHKIVAMTALVMTILHSVGHCVNFYHVTQQPVEHLRCLTKEMQFSGESRPTFFYWIFKTVTGSTGLALWVFCSIVYVFAHQQVRQRAYSYFWSTHKLYYAIYALTLLHGSSKLTGSPRFWLFFIIPATLFTIDKIMSLQAKLWQLEIFETELLPSDVIAVKFARPPSFKFLSGQWVRVACTAFRPHEFHAFTLTSAPQDDHLSVHVRAQGPWTWKFRSLFDPANLQYNRKLIQSQLPPRIRIEGPFGGGNQEWYKYEVAVMIGGGIGVTPYASILNDLVFNTSTNRHSITNYKKVYFIWICPSHRNFEWFIDVLREVEQKDVTNLLEMHIFITQFFHKFDLRTTMLYNRKLIQSQLPPRIRIEGPFGGGNQEWYKYEVAVMIGGGIGVTPYASILNDLVFNTSTNRHSITNYKKVYFIWICPSHRNFEWFIDVLREVEQKDVTNLLEMHIFITQFFHKFDLRTTMLYICENHFQRISNRSLFTGLKAVNHFGRPDIAALLQYVQNQHSCVNKVGVFSCGPKAMTKSVTEACEKVNKRRKLPFFLHQYENFS